MSLHKNINLAGVFSISTGAMISSGIFILPGLAFSIAGPAVILSYVAGGILALLGVFSVIELATAMPKAGGDYYFINRTFGALFGTLSGFLSWFALALKSAFAIYGISEILLLLLGVPVVLSSGLLCILFLLVNLAGVEEAVSFQILMVSGLLILLGAYVLLGLPQMELSRFSRFFGKGINPVIITAGTIFVSFGGLLNVANISEEVKNPKKNIPLGMILSVSVVTLLYGSITLILTGTLPPEVFAQSTTPVADSARLVAGDGGYIAIIVASLLAFITTANAGLMASSRYPLALSRDGLLPPFFARQTRNKKSPIVALSMTAFLMFFALLLPLEVLVKAASTVILTSYVLTNLAVIILRESGLSNYRPSFKAPLYPWLQVGSIILFSFFIMDLGAEAIEISLLFLFGCFCLYLFYGRKNSNTEFALIHLMKKIAETHLGEDQLETELRDILISRDEIEQDHFDELIKNAQVSDIEESVTFSQLLEQMAPKIAAQTGMDPLEIRLRYTQRQEEFNTAVSDFLAIPHIKLEGKDKTYMHIVRCRKGVFFGEDTPGVKAIFFLGGTTDRRVLHLRTIAALASLVREKSFREKWLTIPKAGELKHLMLLSERKRFKN